MRYEAMLSLGIEEAPTELIENLSEEDEKEIIIRDNISNGEWDMEAIANEWSDLPLDDWGLDVNFKNDEVFEFNWKNKEVDTESIMMMWYW